MKNAIAQLTSDVASKRIELDELRAINTALLTKQEYELSDETIAYYTYSHSVQICHRCIEALHQPAEHVGDAGILRKPRKRSLQLRRNDVPFQPHPSRSQAGARL